jgi:COMPASS component SWD2
VEKADSRKYVCVDFAGSGDGNLHAWNINTVQEVPISQILLIILCVVICLTFIFWLQIACWNSHIGPITALKWAPRRAMFATASTALTFWIPNESNSS